MAVMSECALCRQRRELRRSHIIPKFVIRWLKDTSATSYLRQGVKPNVRKQDAEKVDLLCGDCEQRLSVWEGEFARKVFLPFQKNQRLSLRYEGWLLRFAVSLSWRIAYDGKDLINKTRPDLAPYVEEALEVWRRFLLGERRGPGGYAHNIFLMGGPVRDADTTMVPRKFHWYTMRGIDGTLVYNSSEVNVYTLLPGIVFWSGVQPQTTKGWKRTLIKENGKLLVPQTVEANGFGEFLVDRVRIAAGMMDNMSERQREKIAQDVLANPDRLLNSKALEALQAEEVWRLRRELLGEGE